MTLGIPGLLCLDAPGLALAVQLIDPRREVVPDLAELGESEDPRLGAPRGTVIQRRQRVQSRDLDPIKNLVVPRFWP